jgi:rhamnogalacturonan endolyase
MTILHHGVSTRLPGARAAVGAVLASLLAACGGGQSTPDTQLLSATTSVSSASTASSVAVAPSARVLERLGRGVVAVRTSPTAALIHWRLLGLDPDGIAFNVYRSVNGAAPVKLNDAPIAAVTNYTDSASNRALGALTYSVRPVIDGVEQAAGGAFTLKANGAAEPIVRIPLSALPAPDYRTNYVWVGDLDGDGEYDFVLDRIAAFVPGSNDDLGAGNQYLEAYKRDGTRLWQIDLGPGSRNTYNITPGPTTLSMGMYDGATVYDLDGDGKAEVVLKVADGVVFGDGSRFNDADPNQQHLAILDGLTGTPRATVRFPDTFYAQAGRMGTQLGIGYADGVHPNIYFWGRNRNRDKSFNDVFASYSWKGGSTLTELWRMPLVDSSGKQASHQMRIIDVDGDGKDEVATGNFMINSDGTLRYILPGVIHGDRFFIGKFDKHHAGMRGYGIQQNNPSGLLEYYYDATQGSIIWEHSAPPGSIVDVGRGLVGDIDPRFPGFEVWSYSGLYHGETNTLTEPNTGLSPWPSHSIWWDGDVLAEGLNDFKIEKWNPLLPRASNAVPRLVSMTSSTWGSARLNGRNPMFFGDIHGDWRTEVVLLNNTYTELVIFTTNVPTGTRLYTMAHNPAYRNHMTIKGYLQSPLPDYYIGDGMDAPPRPNIRYAGVAGAVGAEAAQLTGGARVRRDASGYQGDGYVDFPATGGSLQWNGVDGGAGGAQTLALRYANGNPTPRSGVLKVNGVAQRITFRITGSDNKWTTLDVPVTLLAGSVNTLRLESTGQDLGNIDEMTVR